MSIRTDRVERQGLSRVPRSYTGEYKPISEEQAQFLSYKFDLQAIKPEYIGTNAYGKFVFRLHDQLGNVRGYQVRNVTWGTIPHPRIGIFRDMPAVKASTFMTNVKDPVLSWYWPSFVMADMAVVVVEDPMSAIKVREAGLPAVALLGVDLSMDKVREIAASKRPVVFAYDQDATELAIDHIKKWGPAFKGASLKMLDYDIKDLPMADVRELFAEELL